MYALIVNIQKHFIHHVFTSNYGVLKYEKKKNDV